MRNFLVGLALCSQGIVHTVVSDYVTKSGSGVAIVIYLFGLFSFSMATALVLAEWAATATLDDERKTREETFFEGFPFPQSLE